MAPLSDEQVAIAACEFLFPDARWRLTNIDGVRIIYATVTEVAASARTEIKKIEDEGVR